MNNIFEFLDMYYECKVPIYKFKFPSAVHAFQALKTDDVLVWDMFSNSSDLRDPKKAHEYGQNLIMYRDWKNKKNQLMLHVLYNKIANCENKQIYNDILKKNFKNISYSINDYEGITNFFEIVDRIKERLIINGKKPLIPTNISSWEYWDRI